jgi:hypothetical protein
MYIVGGFLDSQNISEDVFMKILRKQIYTLLFSTFNLGIL